MKRAERLAKELSLSKIYLRESRCSRSIERVVPSKNKIFIETKSGLMDSDDEKILPFNIIFTVRALNEDSEEVTFQVDAEFCVIYEAQDGLEPSEEELESFGLTNVVFNAWPYAREFVQNTLVRMDLPSFTLPLLRISDLANKMINKGQDESLIPHAENE